MTLNLSATDIYSFFIAQKGLNMELTNKDIHGEEGQSIISTSVRIQQLIYRPGKDESYKTSLNERLTPSQTSSLISSFRYRAELFKSSISLLTEELKLQGEEDIVYNSQIELLVTKTEHFTPWKSLKVHYHRTSNRFPSSLNSADSS